MGAVALEKVNNSSSFHANNQNYKGKSVQTTKYSPFKNSSLNSKGFTTSISSGVAKSASRLFFPAYVGYEGISYMTNVALEMYDNKFKELGIGKYSTTPTSPVSESPTPISSDSAKPIVTSPTPLFEGDTLLSVLKDSTTVNTSIARQLELSNSVALHGNQELNKSIQALTSIISLQSEIDVSYREVELENSVNLANSLSDIRNSISSIESIILQGQEINTAYSEQNLSNADRLDSSLQNIASKVSTVSTLLQNGIQIKKTNEEIDLTTKQLEHITYETTEIQLDNIGDEIPRATPQHMRALKDVAVAKKNSDENTFDLEEEEYNDWFILPDVSSIFNYNYKSARTIEGVNS
ncbi:MAG: hypothetical protein ACJAWW_001612 [Sulfurimonas sp.]|jgi:hypothetical protein